MAKNICSLCDRPVHGQGLCSLHYKRLRRGAPLTDQPRTVAICSLCDSPVKAKGFCQFHYKRFRKGADLTRPRLRALPGTSAYDKIMAQVEWQGDCLVFTGNVNGYGYGIVSDPAVGRNRRAHRVIAEHFLGPSELHVLHTCDNPPCVNIKHLWYGTDADNVADKMAKGRGKGYEPRLSTEEIAAIRADTRLQREIAADYGTTQGYISMLKSGERRRG